MLLTGDSNGVVVMMARGNPRLGSFSKQGLSFVGGHSSETRVCLWIGIKAIARVMRKLIVRSFLDGMFYCCNYQDPPPPPPNPPPLLPPLEKPLDPENELPLKLLRLLVVLLGGV